MNKEQIATIIRSCVVKFQKRLNMYILVIKILSYSHIYIYIYIYIYIQYCDKEKFMSTDLCLQYHNLQLVFVLLLSLVQNPRHALQPSIL